MRRTAVVVLGVAALCVTGLSPADADTIGSKVSIAITTGGTAFAGKVSSSQSACLSSRSVTLRRKSPGSSTFVKLGVTRTSRTGRWTVSTTVVASAQYRVDVARKRLSATRSCRATASSAVTARLTTISLTAAETLAGAVGSPRSACLGKRAVTADQRRVYAASFTKVGAATTNSSGAWTVVHSPVPGHSYRARVAARQVGLDACMAAVSAAHLHRVVHVSPTGNDTDPGSAAAPKLTFDAAISAAAASSPPHAVYVATGVYDEPVHLADGVAVYGGFGANWRPAAEGETAIQAPSPAVVADGATDAHVERISIQSQRGVGDRSAYGILARDSSLVLRDLDVVVDAGAHGTDAPPPPAAPSQAPSGLTGQPGVENSTGFACSSASRPLGGSGGSAPGVRLGGRGGNAGHAASFGEAGQSGGGGAQGGSGVPPGRGAQTPALQHWGSDGAPGDAGQPGAPGGNSATAYTGTGYAPANGTAGGPGAPGEGGGGGGGGGGGTADCDSYGSSGGGGGAGGVAGSGGLAGVSGGGSFGIFLWNSTAVVEHTQITTAPGGDGGDGANGQSGGTGGTGGPGGPYGGSGEQDDGSNGAPGGDGGRGGDGGPGGGGAGGPSVGVLLAGGSTADTTTATITVGAAGAGGSSPGNPGSAGIAEPTLDLS